MPQERVFQEKLKRYQEKKPTPQSLRLWSDIFVYSIILIIVLSLYGLIAGQDFNLRLISRVFAEVAIILIGLSFILSAVCYFWNFAGKYIIYRKELGVIGFMYAAIHGMYSLLMTPDILSFSNLQFFFGEKLLFSTVSAVTALCMYLFMIMISFRQVIEIISGHTWRTLMRIGYFALFLSLIHFFILKKNSWLAWFFGQDQHIVPPMSLIIFLFGIVVLCMRIILWFATHKKKTQTPVSSVSIK